MAKSASMFATKKSTYIDRAGGRLQALLNRRLTMICRRRRFVESASSVVTRVHGYNNKSDCF